MPPTDHPDLPAPGQGSLKPYLLRAIYQWAVDHRLTPQVLVDVEAADAGQVVVPPERVKNGRIVLNIDPQAVAGLEMGNDCLSFSARFAGKPFPVRIPVAAVAAIYCRENNQGIVFRGADGAPPAGGGETKTRGASPAARLKLVK